MKFENNIKYILKMNIFKIEYLFINKVLIFILFIKI